MSIFRRFILKICRFDLVHRVTRTYQLIKGDIWDARRTLGQVFVGLRYRADEVYNVIDILDRFGSDV